MNASTGLTPAHYVPIVKGKAGEYSALQDLAPAVKQAVTPLIEIPVVPWDFENEEPAKTLDAHLARSSEAGASMG